MAAKDSFDVYQHIYICCSLPHPSFTPANSPPAQATANVQTLQYCLGNTHETGTTAQWDHRNQDP